ncbi:hypothetical protein ACFYOC_24170 [Nocardiopsis alba]|uniref:putative phage holin n=1 Tax=Nocardiopsis alba TaxID=53437 RepID=UPI003673F304
MTLFTLGSLLAVTAGTMSVLYTVAYGFTSAWWKSGFGRSHFLLLANTSLLFVLINLAVVFGPHAFLGSEVLRVLTYGSLTVTLLGSLIQYLRLLWVTRNEEV